jgi:hypothetical protein
MSEQTENMYKNEAHITTDSELHYFTLYCIYRLDTIESKIDKLSKVLDSYYDGPG